MRGAIRDFVARVRKAEGEKATGSTQLTSMVARYLFKLMAYKDEYEVARLYTDGEFLRRVENQFEGDYRVVMHLAPPLWAKSDPETGEPKKRTYGPWMMSAMRVLAKLKFLRGGMFDVFGYSAERRMERQLIADYERTVGELLGEARPLARRARRRDRVDPRVHPRLRPGEGAPPEGCEGEGSASCSRSGAIRRHASAPTATIPINGAAA